MDDSPTARSAGRLSFGSSPGVRHLLRMAMVFAAGDHPIAILGERGTGKTTLARVVHDWSGRGGAFAQYQLSSSHDELHLSELFGHARGAFTGAHSEHAGLVESTKDGTLFLDEFGEASHRVQLSLLGLFDRRGFRRLGEGRERPLTTRLIVATNADLEARVVAGAFRRDLLDRVGYFVLEVPPLRHRVDEIVPLFRSLVAEHAPGGPHTIQLSPDVELALEASSWPGNIRQLENVARYASRLMEPNEPVAVQDLPRRFLEELGLPAVRRGRATDDVIKAALRATGGNVSEAARQLHLSRRTVQRRMRADRA